MLASIPLVHCIHYGLWLFHCHHRTDCNFIQIPVRNYGCDFNDCLSSGVTSDARRFLQLFAYIGETFLLINLYASDGANLTRPFFVRRPIGDRNNRLFRNPFELRAGKLSSKFETNPTSRCCEINSCTRDEPHRPEPMMNTNLIFVSADITADATTYGPGSHQSIIVTGGRLLRPVENHAQQRQLLQNIQAFFQYVT